MQVKAGSVYIEVELKGLEEARAKIAATMRDAGATVADRFSEDFNKRVNDKVSANRSLGSRLAGLFSRSGNDSGNSFVDTFGKRLSSGLESVVAPIMNNKLVAILVASAPLLAAAFTSALGTATSTGFLAVGALALKNNKQLQKEFKSSWASITKTFATAAAPLVGPFTSALRQISAIVAILGPSLRSIFRDVGSLVKPLTTGFGLFLSGILGGIQRALPGINAATLAFAQALGPLGQTIGKLFADIFAHPEVIARTTGEVFNLINLALNPLGKIISGLNVIFGAFYNILKIGVEGLGSAISGLINWSTKGTAAVANLSKAWGPLWSAVKRVWDALVAFAAAKTDQDIYNKFVVLSQRIKEAWGPLKTFLSAVWDAAWATIKNIWNSKVVPWWNGTALPWIKSKIKDAAVSLIKSMASEIVSQFTGLPSRTSRALVDLAARVVSALNSLPGKAYSAGVNLIQGLINGIQAMAGRLFNIASNIASSVIDRVKSIFDIGSPSKVFHQIGVWNMEGLVNGMRSQVPDLNKTIAQVSLARPAPFEPYYGSPSQPLHDLNGGGANITQNFYDADVTPDQVAERLWFTLNARGGLA